MGSKRKLRILVTTGDPDGIGLEVSRKALQAIGPQPGVQFVLMQNSQVKLGPVPRFRRRIAATLNEVGQLPFDFGTLIEVASAQPAALWVEDAARACLDQRFDAMVTAPLSKTSIIDAGLKDIGHTEILARVAKAPDLFMGFIGEKFNVVLATGHRSLKQTLIDLNVRQIKKALNAARELRAVLEAKVRRRPIALVGVNPHAGERGLIGSEEKWMLRLIGGDVHGPLVPDAAFLPKMWAKYSVYVTPYHDQGLIPFKLVHGFAGGVHLTLGLPFVRTSVDHGTAKDLFGLNRAESGSMQDALTTAIKLARRETTR